ncbi:MAG: acetyl-CoA carboxylase, biotin carboxylase subunit [Candidatus Atribacteria bacterium]|nr:acetyl-CoA carboxylase, biotin carboxylase subunit [Candidatus Atribacteria bacterium]
MFDKILIANRGEIAFRIVRACREMGIKTVGIFSDVDRELLHLRFVDQKVSLGGDKADETYLDIEKIIKVCHLTHPAAVHPGYGFLAENFLLARRLEAEGITFIGPQAEILEKMKNKLFTKKVVQEAGIPVIPGSLTPITDLSEAKTVAREVGYPLAVKACLGGGGRGIRVVERAEGLEEAFLRAKREAALAFGSDEVYIEKLLGRARHIEVQILADKFGKVVHLGERECSLQRRRQKILEEAPAPTLDREVRNKILQAAVAATQALGYSTCGTLEFLVTEEGKYYFMEFNARIQVEHPVTEMITGVDIVREQISLAAGEPLSLKQEDIIIRGHAIEMRVNAENPDKNFAPSPGKISKFDLPRGPGVRVDSHCYSGYTVPSYYDSLVAKVVVWDSDRKFAIRRARETLQSMEVSGIHTTIPFQMKILQNPEFMEGSFHTRFIEEDFLPD